MGAAGVKESRGAGEIPGLRPKKEVIIIFFTIFLDKACSAVLVKERKDGLEIAGSVRLPFRESCLADKAELKDLFAGAARMLFRRAALPYSPLLSYKGGASVRLCLIFGAAAGVSYRTWREAAGSFRKTGTAAEREKEALALAYSHLPGELSELYRGFVPLIVSSGSFDAEVALTAAYLPEVFLKNALRAARELGFSVAGCTEPLSCVNALVDAGDVELCFELPGYLALVNSAGAAAWSVPGGAFKDGCDVLYAIASAAFGKKTGVRRRVLDDLTGLAPYFRVKIYGELPDTALILAAGAALACTEKSAPLAENKARAAHKGVLKGGGRHITGKLRQFFS